MLFAAAAVVLLPGCVPWGGTYGRVEAPEARHLQSTCGDYGPPEVTYYPFHGIFISVDPSRAFIGLHIPAGMNAQWDDDKVTVTGEARNGPVNMTIHLKPAPHGMTGSSRPIEFVYRPDPFDPTRTTLSPLEGATVKGRPLWYLFVGRDDRRPGFFVTPPPGLTEGTIELPPITVNGQHYPAQVLPIRRAQFFSVMPVNC